jgi:Flp pilus assembly protein TadD
LLRGRILNLQDFEYNKNAEDDLSKAIKLNPKSVEAWNALGECLFKKNDRVGGYRCFNSSLKLVILDLKV